MSSLSTVLFLLCAIVVLVYKFFVWNFDYWRRRGVNGPKPWPLLGSFPNLFLQRQHFADDINDVYKRYNATENFVGVFLIRTPQLLILEPGLVRQIFVGAFKHFENNDAGRLVDPHKDPLIASNPFLLTGDQWRKQRAMITPVLSSARIRTAYGTMQRVCADLCDYIKEQTGRGCINAKHLALLFTAESLCDCVLGVKARSFTAEPLPVSDHIRLLSEQNLIFLIYAAMTGIVPNIVKLYKAKFVPAACEGFFLKLILEAFQLRRTQPAERRDFLNQLLELQQRQRLTDLQLASHAMTFLIDGLDTTAAAIAHCLLLLARTPECQAKLEQELAANVDAVAGGQLSFEQINELPYLNACFNESLRIFPPGLWAMKTCTSPFELINKNGRKLRLLPGDTVILPIYGIHHDAKFYPQPERFMPERFLCDGLRECRNAGVFLGFGDGPRMCLGVRLALVQAKAAIAAIVQRFEVLVNAKTKPQNKLDSKVFVAMQDGGVWLDFKERHSRIDRSL